MKKWVLRLFCTGLCLLMFCMVACTVSDPVTDSMPVSSIANTSSFSSSFIPYYPPSSSTPVSPTSFSSSGLMYGPLDSIWLEDEAFVPGTDPGYPPFGPGPVELPPAPTLLSIPPAEEQGRYYTNPTGHIQGASFVYGDTEIALPNEIKVLIAGLNYVATFASNEVLVIAVPKKPSTIATSHDGGETWNIVELLLDKSSPRFAQIGFSTEQDGWILFRYPHDNFSNYWDYYSENLLYTTADGGKTWHRQASILSPGLSPHCVFASPSIGWVSSQITSSDMPYVYTTQDGGKTWYRTSFYLHAEMQQGLQYFSDERNIPLHWNGKQWVLQAYERRVSGYPSNVYEFTPNTDGNWIWNDPGWKLPANVSAIHLSDWLTNWLYPNTYSPQQGLDELDANGGPGSFLWNITDYMRRGTIPCAWKPGEIEEIAVPAAYINDMANALFSDDAFDAAKCSSYESPYGSVMVPVAWPLGSPAQTINIQSCKTLSDGTIEVVYQRNLGYTDGPDTVESFTQYVLLRPITLYGIQMFTLLSAKVL